MDVCRGLTCLGVLYKVKRLRSCAAYSYRERMSRRSVIFLLVIQINCARRRSRVIYLP